MEWVETTGKSIDEATELALDQLGVIGTEADVEVLEEPRQGMFGRVRGTARVRARIRPTAPPSKESRARKGRRQSSKKAGSDSRSGRSDQGKRKTAGDKAADEKAAREKSRDGGGRGRDHGSKDTKRSRSGERELMAEQEQRSVGEEFLSGMLDSMGLSATVSSSLDEDGILAFEVDGDQLGLLMGPGLNTLDAIQEVCRNAIQRQADGREYGKVIVDVSGARRDRTAALEDFVRTEAQAVVDSGEDVIFEVMSRSDRKIVHDVVSTLDGVVTESVGEDPRRRVVLRAA